MTGGEKSPPRRAKAILDRMRIYNDSFECSGDLEEEYNHILEREGRSRADRWYWHQVLASLPAYVALTSYWWFVMFGSYIRSMLRNMRRFKGYTILNVAGLVLGLVCSQLIFLFVYDEARYDSFHENADRIFQVYSREESGSGESRIYTGSYFPLSGLISEEAAPVDLSTRYYQEDEMTVSAGDGKGIQCRGSYVDRSFFSIFTFPLVSGDMETPLPDRDSIILSRSLAYRLFGDLDVSGKTVRVGAGRELQVSGVMEDVPRRSSLRFDCVLPFRALFRSGNEPDHWGGNPLVTFVMIGKGQDPAAIAPLITGIARAHNPRENTVETFMLHPLRRMHLYQPGGGGMIRILVIFGIVAFAVLLIAWINFANLNTARASTRMREVVMRKVLGARKEDLIEQFIGESILVSSIALVISAGAVILLLPHFNRILGKSLSPGVLLSPPVIAGFLLIALVTGLMSGIYPAVCLSGVRTAAMLRMNSRTVAGGSRLRKVLVVTQFALSIFMMTVTLGIYRQLDYIKSKDLGFRSDEVLTVRMTGGVGKDLSVLKSDLLERSGILSVSSSMQHPAHIGSTVSNADWPGRDRDLQVVMHWDHVGYDYFRTFGMEILEGRAFSEDFPTDVDAGYIVNQEAVRKMGLESPVGTRLSVFGKEGSIIGVVKDFHFQPLYSDIKPFVFMLRPGSISFLYVRAGTGIEAVEATVLEVCRRFDPDAGFEVMHFDDIMMDYIYSSERQMKEMATYFAGLALLIACMGLLGLSSFLAEKRRKEMSIRRVMGASTRKVMAIFMREFALWVVLAWAVAVPASDMALKSFLSDYAYHFDPGLTLFLIPGSAALVIALGTVSIQAFRTALAGPAEVLRSE